MRRIFSIVPALLLGVAIAQPALAQACRDQIVALYDGGAMDDGARRPHHIEMTQHASDGTISERHVGDVISGTHYTLYSEISKNAVLYVGTDIWYKMGGQDGPWGNHQEMPAVRADDLRQQLAEKAASVSEAECLGQMDNGGKPYTVFRWRVFTETLKEYGGGVNGAVHEAWVDPDTGELAMRKDTDVVTPWKKEPDGSFVVTRFDYDDSITILPPEE